MPYVLRVRDPAQHPSVQVFVESFDVETDQIVLTGDLEAALVLPDFEAVENAWRSRSPWALRPCLDQLDVVAQSVEDLKGR